MPNWCSNQMKIAGDEDVLKEIESKGAGEDFKFGHYVPMPQEIRKMCTGRTEIRGEQFNYWTSEYFPDPDCQFCKAPYLYACSNHTLNTGVPESEIQRIAKLYGTADWMEWAITHWGTKWDVDVAFAGRSENTILLNFDTAWAPPHEFCIEFSRQYPVYISLSYCEIGMDFWGHCEFHQGVAYQVTADNVSNYFDENVHEDERFDIEKLLEPLQSFMVEHQLNLGG